MYAYVEGSLPNMPGQKAILESPLVHLTSHPLCFSFWYHMKGKGIGSLQVEKQNKNENQVLFNLNGHQNDQWQFIQIDILENQPFKVG